MTRKEIRDALIQALRQVTAESGKPHDEIDDETRPYVDLGGFDSLNRVEIEVMLSERLGAEIADVLVAKDERATNVTVGEWVERVCKIVHLEGKRE